MTADENMTADETVTHILAEHQMGETGCDAPNDPALADLWAEIQADPVGWHTEDHRVHGLAPDDHDTNWA